MNDVTLLEGQAEAFRRQYHPRSLDDRLAWLDEYLHIGKERLLRLMGLSKGDAQEALPLDWQEVVRRWPDRARWAEGLLRYLIHQYRDWELLAGYFDEAGKTAPGELPPYPEAHLEKLLEHIVEGGPMVYSHVFQYLAGRPIPTRSPD